MIELPPFTTDGLLPPGEYLLALDELPDSPLVLGPGDPKIYPHWDARWRETLVANLAILVRQLWAVGITEIFIDGSFVEDKDHPNDIDGYFVCDLRRLATGDLQRELTQSTPIRFGPGIPRLVGRIVDIRRGNSPCGTNTAWSCIRTTGSRAEFETSMGMNWNFLPPSGNRAETASRRASSRLEAIHDS